MSPLEATFKTAKAAEEICVEDGEIVSEHAAPVVKKVSRRIQGSHGWATFGFYKSEY